MIKDFNNYSKERGLNINLSLTYFSDLNNTKGYSDYDLTLSLLGKKHHKYDMFLYDMNYLKIYAPYLLELENYLPKKCIDLYSSENNNKLTVYNEHRLGLVKIYIYIFIMNKFYLYIYILKYIFFITICFYINIYIFI